MNVCMGEMVCECVRLGEVVCECAFRRDGV